MNSTQRYATDYWNLSTRLRMQFESWADEATIVDTQTENKPKKSIQRAEEAKGKRTCAYQPTFSHLHTCTGIAFHRVPLQPKNEKSMKPPVKFSPESVTAICDTRKHTARLLFTVAKRRYRNLRALMEVSCQS